MTFDTVQEIEHNIKQAQEIVDLGKALERLRLNRDFKKIVLEGFFEKEAIRLVHLKSDQSQQTPERQQSILTQIDAIGVLHQYFNTVLFKARQAEKAVEDNEATLAEIAAEELNHG